MPDFDLWERQLQQEGIGKVPSGAPDFDAWEAKLAQEGLPGAEKKPEGTIMGGILEKLGFTTKPYQPDEREQIHQVLDVYRDKNFVKRILEPDKYPKIETGDGREATHKMAWAQVGDDYVVFPTVVYDPQAKQLRDLGTDALDHALKTGEFIPFKSAEDADRFSKRYKQVWEKRPSEKDLRPGEDILGELELLETTGVGIAPELAQAGMGFMKSSTLGIPQAVGRELTGFDFDIAPKSTGEKIGRGAGELLGFIGGPAGQLVAKGAGKTLGRMFPALLTGGGRLATAGKGIILESFSLASAMPVLHAGDLLSTSGAGEFIDKAVDHAKAGAQLGATFGAAKGLLPSNTVKSRIARILGGIVALDAQRGTRPWDTRPLKQKVFDYGVDVYFLWHGAGERTLDIADRHIQKGEAPEKVMAETAKEARKNYTKEKLKKGQDLDDADPVLDHLVNMETLYERAVQEESKAEVPKSPGEALARTLQRGVPETEAPTPGETVTLARPTTGTKSLRLEAKPTPEVNNANDMIDLLEADAQERTGELKYRRGYYDKRMEGLTATERKKVKDWAKEHDNPHIREFGAGTVPARKPRQKAPGKDLSELIRGFPEGEEAEVSPRGAEPAEEPSYIPTMEEPSPTAKPDFEKWERDIRAETEAPAPRGEVKINVGKGNRSYTPKGNEIDSSFAVVDVNDLVASHDEAGNINPDYPEGLQPRDRARAVSKLQILKIANNLKPELLGDSKKVQDGSPIVGSDLVVESGNARTLALKHAYDELNAGDYRMWLLENAESFGIDRNEVESMDQPVLVRIRRTEVDRPEFAREANQADIATLRPAEQARADAKRITDDFLDHYAPDESGNILAASNRQFVRKFLERLGTEEAAGLLNKEGMPTKQLGDRLQAAIFAKVYGDPKLIELMAEDADPGVKNILNALNIAAPEFARARKIGEFGDLNVVPQIVEGLKLVITARNKGYAVESYLKQMDLFERAPEDVANMALFMERNNRSARKMGIGFRAMAEFIGKELRHRRNYGLFGEEEAGKKDVLAAANREISDTYASTKQGDLIRFSRKEPEETYPPGWTHLEEPRPGDLKRRGKWLYTESEAKKALQTRKDTSPETHHIVPVKQINPITEGDAGSGKPMQGYVIRRGRGKSPLEYEKDTLRKLYPEATEGQLEHLAGNAIARSRLAKGQVTLEDVADKYATRPLEEPPPRATELGKRLRKARAKSKAETPEVLAEYPELAGEKRVSEVGPRGAPPGPTSQAEGAVKEPATTPTKPKGKEPQYAVTERSGAQHPVTLRDVKEIFKGQEVGQTEDGDIWVRTKSGHGLIIRNVEEISVDKRALHMAHGPLKEGQKVTAKYESGTVELVRDATGKWTLSHESVHWMEDTGILNALDIQLLKKHIKKIHGQGKFKTRNPKDVGGAEDRANYIADQLHKRQDLKGLSRIMAKLREWIDRFINLFQRTAAGVVREIETGKIFEREVAGRRYQTEVPAYDAMAARWYFQMEQVLAQKLPGKGPPKMFAQTIQAWVKKGMFRQEELEWSGVMEWLEGPRYIVEQGEYREKRGKPGPFHIVWNVIDSNTGQKAVSGFITSKESAQRKADELNKSRKITKQEVLDFLAENQVRVEEVLRGGPSVLTAAFEMADWNEIQDELDQRGAAEIDDEFHVEDEEGAGVGLYRDGERIDIYDDLTELAKDYAEIIAGREGAPTPTKFADYTEPGGEGYRELLFILPSARERESLRADAQEAADFLDIPLERVTLKKLQDADAPAHLIDAFEKWMYPAVGGWGETGFRGSHWEEPNVVAHVRLNERVGPNGEKILFLEEVQSDWHQEGRKKGYRGKPIQPEEIAIKRVPIEEVRDVIGFDLIDSIREWREKNNISLDEPVVVYALKGSNKWSIHYDPRLTDEEIYKMVAAKRDDTVLGVENLRRLEGIPDAPFKQTWPLLVMKRMIRWAAEHGFDQVAWTPGVMQVERYERELSRRVDRIQWARTSDIEIREKKDDRGEPVYVLYVGGQEDRAYATRVGAEEGAALHKKRDDIQIVAEKGGEEIFEAFVPLSGTTEIEGHTASLDDLLGKEMAAQIRASKESSGHFEGPDLTIGGQGMKGFYDKILPALVNRFVKKWKAKVGRTELTKPAVAVRELGMSGDKFEIYDTETGDAVDAPFRTYEEASKEAERRNAAEEKKTKPIHSLPITEQMKDVALHEGMPLFAVEKEPGAARGKKPLFSLKEDMEKDDPRYEEVAKPLGRLYEETRDHLERFERALVEEKRIVAPYDGESFEPPERQVPYISEEEPVAPERDINPYNPRRSPHNVMKDLEEFNPVGEALEANMAFGVNTGNAMKWADTVLKEIPDARDKVIEAVKPIFQEYRPLLEEYSKLHDQRRVIINRLGKTRTASKYQRYATELRRRQTELNRLEKERAAAKMQSTKDRKTLQIKHLKREIKYRERKMEEIEQGKKGAVDARYANMIKEAKELQAQIKEAGEALGPLIKEYDKVARALAEEHPDARIALYASGELPEGIELSPKELRVAEALETYMKQTGEDLDALGIPVIKHKKYMTHLWKELLDDAAGLPPLFKKFRRRLPTVLAFMSRLPESRMWVPSANAVMEAYVPMAEYKLAMQPFLNKWVPFIESVQKPNLRKYMQDWLQENLYRRADTILDKGVNAVVDFEYVRLIGASLSVAFKHLLKLPNTWARYGFGLGTEATGKTVKATVDTAMVRLGMKKNPTLETRLIRSFVTSRALVNVLDEIPNMKSSGWRYAARRLTGQPTIAVEAFDNGVSILAGIISGQRKGLTPDQTMRGIYSTILDCNFRSGWDQPLFWKKPLTRAALMFQQTPYKLYEFKHNLIEGAIRGEKDVFGTHYGTMLIRYAMILGAAELVARKFDTSIFEIFLHPPFFRHLLKSFRKPPYVGAEDPREWKPAISPVLDLVKSMSKRGAAEGLKEHFKYMGTYTKVKRALKGDYNRKYYDDPIKYVLSLPKVEPGGAGPTRGRPRRRPWRRPRRSIGR